MDINSSKNKSLKKNIAIFHHQYSYGGVDTQLISLLNYWPNKDDFFYLISNKDNQGLEYIKKNIINTNIEYLYIEELDKNQNKFFINFTKVHKKLNSIMISKSINNLLINNGGFPGSLYALILCTLKYSKINSSKIFLLIHHAPIFYNKKIKIISLLLSFLITLKKIKIITVSKASKKELEENTFLKNISVINNGVDILKKYERYSMFNHNSLKSTNFKNKIIIGMIGPLDSHKGHNFILKIISKLDINKYIFIIVGKGDEKKSIENLINQLNLNENVFLTGYIDKHQFSIIENFDIILFPTRDFEGFGYSIAEAMFLKKTILASAVGAIPEFVENGKNGFLIHPNNSDEWYNTLIKCIDNYKMRIALGENAHLTISKKFTAKKMSNAYYKKII